MLLFTFHNVSINSNCRPVSSYDEANLHSIMYLLILIATSKRAREIIFTFHNVSINSLLHLFSPPVPNLFTFHNVSINSLNTENSELHEGHLHSIMYLLIRR